MNASFSLEQVSRLTAEIVADLLHEDGADLAVDVVEYGSVDRPVPPELLTAVWEVEAGPVREPVSVLFTIPRWDGAICMVSLDEFVPRHDDPESGLFATVVAARNDPSQVLSVAAVCAFARAGAGNVIDERRYLGGMREQSPEEVVARLRVPNRRESRRAALAEFLDRTTLGRYD